MNEQKLPVVSATGMNCSEISTLKQNYYVESFDDYYLAIVSGSGDKRIIEEYIKKQRIYYVLKKKK